MGLLLVIYTDMVQKNVDSEWAVHSSTEPCIPHNLCCSVNITTQQEMYVLRYIRNGKIMIVFYWRKNLLVV